tara:strand:+ start:189 stop:1571 length:1383 start_codon:yes stop_codon:yes gene_type:complete
MAIASALPDYQLYTIPIGDEYSRVHSPFVANKATIKAGINHSYGPFITKTNSGPITYDIRHLTNYGLSAGKTFGKGSIKPFVVGQAALETNIGEIEQQNLLQHRAVIGGLSFHEEGRGKSAVGVIKGTGFNSKSPATGLLISFGLDKKNWGLAGSAVMEDINSSDSAIKLTGGLYMSKNKSRFMIEYDKQIDNQYSPDEVSIGLRKTMVKNERNIHIISSISYGLTNMPGSAPRFNIAVSFNLNKNKKEVEHEEEVVVEEQEEEQIIEEESVVAEPEVESDDEELFIITETKGEELERPKVETVPPRRTSRQKPTTTEDSPMPDNSTTTVAQETQPDPTVNSLNQIAQTTGGDSSLTLMLAMLAVVGGGAAWKFYTQYSEQKHEQKMKQLELEAQAAGLAGAQPPPCQAAKVKLEAELEQIKTKVDGLDRKLAFTADFDADLLERRMKKLERKLQDMEEE